MNIDESGFHQIVKLNLSTKGKDLVLKYIKKLELRSDVIAAFPNYICKPAIVPNDTEYVNDNQWAIDNISLTSAWNITTGSNSVKVGVIDSGINKNHSDLINRYNSTLSVNLSGSSAPYVDDGGHGTKVAGVIGAQGNNSKGISGACWNVSLVSLKATHLDSDGEYSIYLSDLSKAIDYANENNIPILNYSYSMASEFHSNLSISLGNYSGLFVCSAGNDNSDLTTVETAIIGYNSTNTIVVAGSGKNNDTYFYIDEDNVEHGSNYSKTKVDLAAPGYEIRTTSSSGNYVYAYGTSLAAPYVTGVAALLKSKYPAMSARTIKYYIEGNVDIIPALSNKVKTGGRLNAYEALNAVKTYTVKYNSNGGTGTMSNTTVIYNNYTSLRANTFTKNNYTFIGWHAKRASDNKCYFTNGQSSGWYLEGSQPGGYDYYLYPDKKTVFNTTKVDGDIVTMTAQWAPKYTLAFNGNDEDSGTMTNLTKTYGIAYNLPANTFTRTSCVFDHWYAKNSSGKMYYTGSNGQGWYTPGEQPSGYTRKKFTNGMYIQGSTIQGITAGSTITMNAYWELASSQLGDVNVDDVINVQDVSLVQKYISGTASLTTYQQVAADVNFSGTIDIRDVSLLQKYISNIVDEFGD